MSSPDRTQRSLSNVPERTTTAASQVDNTDLQRIPSTGPRPVLKDSKPRGKSASVPSQSQKTTKKTRSALAVCRYCRGSSIAKGRLWDPCGCDRRDRYVHTECLVQMLVRSKRKKRCEYCGEEFGMPQGSYRTQLEREELVQSWMESQQEARDRRPRWKRILRKSGNIFCAVCESMLIPRPK